MEKKKFTAGELIASAIMIEGGMFFLAIPLGWLFGLETLGRFHFDWIDLRTGLLATLPPIGLLAVSVLLPLRSMRRLKAVVRRLLLPAFSGCSWAQIAMICALAGLGEEMLFRAIAQEGLARLSGGLLGPEVGVCFGLVAASLIFGVFHALTRTYFVLATLMCFYFGWIYLATGNLLVPMVAHGLYDFVAITYFLWRYRGSVQPSISP